MGLRLLIADDHTLVRAGLRAILQGVPGWQIVAEAGDGESAIKLAEETCPEVAILDIRMRGSDGIVATRRLKASSPQIKVLILTAHDDQELLREAIEAGAAGYVVKRALDSELIDAVLAVVRGDLYVDPAMVRGLMQNVDSPDESPRRSPSGLTPREEEVLALIAEGMTNWQIAVRLSVSQRTVESHRAAIVGKTGLHNRAQLSDFARQRGLLRSR